MSLYRFGRFFRSGSLIFAVAALVAGAAMAQSNTTVGAGTSSGPVMLGNNAAAANAPSSSNTRDAGPSPWSFFSSGSASTTPTGPTFSDAMKQTNESMSANANAFAAAREKHLQQSAADERAKYDQEMSAQNHKNGKGSAGSAGQQDAAPVTMQYKAPDTSSAPARTFSIE